MKATAVISLALVSAIALPVWADNTSTPLIDKREANQEKRIEQGEKSGALTQGEAAHLEKREAKLQSDEAAAKSDGKVTKAERKKLRHEEDRDSQAIYRKKHNDRTQ